MERFKWVKDLAVTEQQNEESGLVNPAYLEDYTSLDELTYEFLRDLKVSFLEAVSMFNKLKPSPLGQVKIYGISKTVADFMLFRNGFRMVFAYKKPGTISIASSQIHQPYEGGRASIHEESVSAYQGAFGQFHWCYKEQPVELSYMTRFYLTQFVRQSSR